MEVSYQTLTVNELSELIGGFSAYQAGYATGRAIAIAAVAATFAAL
ncbi:hypothetical protein [Streptococcus macacae]|uniref:Uncharacterized protein n=1 Tax=Streptococcus macacae NCTC 11558 TaxID=764298 RepID=G5JXM5_9STRE|nr:hypothetical protein [Streptococcus macacae]EHJ52788.1 hypothetical protein STRMA_1649 [Streptococcus macacae NCTC 11558]SUN77583.1 Uncharacterised protein [Streptococcus macacae NCTC 11558]